MYALSRRFFTTIPLDVLLFFLSKTIIKSGKQRSFTTVLSVLFLSFIKMLTKKLIRIMHSSYHVVVIPALEECLCRANLSVYDSILNNFLRSQRNQ